MPWVMLAMAVMQAGMSMASQRSQLNAATDAENQSVTNRIDNSQDLLKKQVQQRGARGSVLGGTPQTAQAAQQAQQSILSSTSDKMSLLGA